MKTLLVPTDFSEYGTTAARTAVQIAAKTGAHIVLMHNIQTLIKWKSLPEAEQQEYPETLGKTVEAADKLARFVKSKLFRNVSVKSVITHGITYEEIVMQASRLKADMIIMGSHGNEGSNKFFIGSNVQKVIRETSLPVLSVKKDFTGKRWRKVVFAASFDEDMEKSFTRIKNLAGSLGATIHLLFVNTPSNFKDTRTVKSQMKSFMKKYPEVKFETVVYNHHDLDGGILEYAEDAGADWIAMATHYRRHAPKYLVSVTESVVFHAALPVVSIRM